MGPRAEFGACLATMYGNFGGQHQHQARMFVDHMHQLGVHHFHFYITKRNITFDSGGRAWHDGAPDQPLPHMQGVEWVHVDTFPIDVR